MVFTPMAGAETPATERLKTMNTHFEITTDLKRGAQRVYCMDSKTGGFLVVREACSFRTPTKSAKFETVEECRTWAAQFVKAA